MRAEWICGADLICRADLGWGMHMRGDEMRRNLPGRSHQFTTGRQADWRLEDADGLDMRNGTGTRHAYARKFEAAQSAPVRSQHFTTGRQAGWRPQVRDGQER